MNENIWYKSSHMINIAGNYELPIFSDKGDRVAIATGLSEDACRMNAAAIIEGLKLREEKVKSVNQPIGNLSADSECDHPPPQALYITKLFRIGLTQFRYLDFDKA